MKKRMVSCMMAAVMAVSALTGCAGGNSVPEGVEGNPAVEGGTEKTESAAEKGNSQEGKSDITLSFGCSQSELPSSGIFQKLCEDYEAETGVHIDIQVTPDAQWHDVLRTKLSVGEAPDIFMADADGLSMEDRVAPVVNCVPLTNEPWVERMSSTVKNDLSVDGELYGISFKGYKFWLYYYNKDIFAKLNLQEPDNYAEFKEVCQKILDSGTIPVYEAVQDGWHHSLMFYEVAGPLFEKEIPGAFDKLNKNEIKLTDFKSALTVLTEMQEFAQKGFYGDDYMSNSMSGDLKAMAEGQTAMTFEQNGWLQQLETEYPEMKGKIGYFVLPWGDNQDIGITATQNAMFINKNSRYIEEAKAFFHYLAQPEKLQEYLDGDTSIYAVCWDGIDSKYPEDLQAFLDAHDQYPVLQSGVKYIGAQWMDVQKYASSMFLGQMTPEEALQKMAGIMDEQGGLQNDPYWTEK